MGLSENQLHNQFKFNQNPSEGAFASLKFISTMMVVSNLNKQIKMRLNQTFNLSEEIQKLENSKFDLEYIYKLQHKIAGASEILNELDKKFKYILTKLEKVDEDLCNCPLNKSIDISINNGTICINENKIDTQTH